MCEHLTDGDSIIENTVGDCSEVKVRLRGVDVGCLIDTGALQHPASIFGKYLFG